MVEYNKSIDTILDEIYTEHNGFLDIEIEEAEKRTGVKFPEFLKNYYKKYGKHSINYSYNELLKPNKIHTLYQSLEEINEDPEDFVDTFGEDINRVKENTCNYLKFYSENQGVWTAALSFDTIDKPQSHVFYDLNGFTDWQFMSNSLESFFLSMLWENIVFSEYEFEHIINDTELIRQTLQNNGIDLELFTTTNLDNKYCRTCYNKAQQKLYIGLVNKENKLVELAIINYHQLNS